MYQLWKFSWFLCRTRGNLKEGYLYRSWQYLQPAVSKSFDSKMSAFMDIRHANELDRNIRVSRYNKPEQWQPSVSYITWDMYSVFLVTQVYVSTT